MDLEILNNAVDEITNNFDEGTINIILDSDNKTVTIEDSGRGMRIADETDGKPNYYWLFLKLFAGTKYDENEQINSGTNGLGATVVNYTSTLFKVESCYDGNKYIIEFENGGDIKVPLTNLGKTDKHGTKITFKLDDTIYTNTTYDQFELIDIISKISGCSNKITFNFTYNNCKKIFHYDDIQEYFKQNIDEKCFYFQKRTYNDNNELSKLSLVFNSSLEPIQQVMLNKNYLSEGGTINKGFIEGFRNESNKYAKELGLFQKKEKNISLEDIENSISFYIDFESSKIEFANQTKFSTKKELYREITKKIYSRMFRSF